MTALVKHIKLLVLMIALAGGMHSQILIDMGNYRNLAYTSVGYNGSFPNATIGIARRDYSRILHRELIGLLDVSLPLTDKFFTRHSIKKGFQVFLLNWNGPCRMPFSFASSSIIRHNNLLKYDDITAEFAVNPGIYTSKFTLAADARIEVIVLRHILYSDKYKHEVDNKAHNEWRDPLTNIFKLGIVAAYNTKRLAVYVKAGYESNRHLSFVDVPGYVVTGLGFKFGTRPMKHAPK